MPVTVYRLWTVYSLVLVLCSHNVRPVVFGDTTCADAAAAVDNVVSSYLRPDVPTGDATCVLNTFLADNIDCAATAATLNAAVADFAANPTGFRQCTPPTNAPTAPTVAPTAPTAVPTSPTSPPTASPTASPTAAPTSPTAAPTRPTSAPTAPSAAPTANPTAAGLLLCRGGSVIKAHQLVRSAITVTDCNTKLEGLNNVLEGCSTIGTARLECQSDPTNGAVSALP